MNNSEIKEMSKITIEILDYDNETELDKIYEFLNNSNKSVVQQYPLIKYLYTKKNEKFYYLYCKENDTIVGTLSFVIYINSIGNIVQSNPILGYGGIVCEENNIEEIFNLLLNKMLEIAKSYKCILVTLGTSILDNNLSIYKKIFKPDFIKENFYQYNILDDLPINKLTSKRRCSIKNKINKSISNNLKIIKNDLKYFNEWYKIHTERFNEIQANVLPYDFLSNLCNCFINKNLADFYYILFDKQLIGGTLFIYNNNVMDYFITSFKKEYMNLNGCQLLLSKIHEDAFKRNIKIFNWESSPSKDGGVYEFKEGWGALEGRHYYLTKVTENIDYLKNIDIDKLKKQYKGYYLMPYEYLN